MLSRDSSVGIATGYWLDGQGSIFGRGKIFFFTPHGPDRLWGLLFKWYKRLYALG
jgi:hypothetical protein